MELPKPKYTVTDKNHRYTVLLSDGSTVGPLKSVTGILGIIAKPALIPWAAREAANHFKTEILRRGRNAMDPETLEQIAKDAAQAHRRKAGDAADLGTKAHAIFDAILCGQEPAEIPEELKEPALDFKRWRLSTDIEIVATEIAVASVKNSYGGRIDAVGWSKSRGGFGIVDFKTSKSLLYGNDYSYQVGGYASALMEQYIVDVTWAEIVRFGKVAPFDSESRSVTDLKGAIDGFYAARALSCHEENKMIGEPNFCTKELRETLDAKPIKKKSPSSTLGF